MSLCCTLAGRLAGCAGAGMQEKHGQAGRRRGGTSGPDVRGGRRRAAPTDSGAPEGMEERTIRCDILTF